MMKLRRTTPPIAPPIMTPVLLGLVDVDGTGAVVAPEGLSELFVGSVVGCSELFVDGVVVGCSVLDVGAIDCNGESMVVEAAVDGGTELGVELAGGVTMTVTDDAGFICETVFTASAALDDHTIAAGQSMPPPTGFSASSA